MAVVVELEERGRLGVLGLALEELLLERFAELGGDDVEDVLADPAQHLGVVVGRDLQQVVAGLGADAGVDVADLAVGCLDLVGDRVHRRDDHLRLVDPQRPSGESLADRGVQVLLQGSCPAGPAVRPHPWSTASGVPTTGGCGVPRSHPPAAAGRPRHRPGTPATSRRPTAESPPPASASRPDQTRHPATASRARRAPSPPAPAPQPRQARRPGRCPAHATRAAGRWRRCSLGRPFRRGLAFDHMFDSSADHRHRPAANSTGCCNEPRC